MTNTQTNDAAKAKAEASFKRREQQARDGVIAMKEYLASQEAMRAKTERLRAQRLAQETAKETAKEAAAAEKPTKPAKVKAKQA